MTRDGHAYAPGTVEARALVLSAPLSFWGGIDVDTGCVIDRSHPDVGRCVIGLVLVMPGGRGSSSSSSVLAECLRRGTGPAAILLAIPDPILTVGAIVARVLYDRSCPIIACAIAGLVTDDRLRVEAESTGPARITVLA